MSSAADEPLSRAFNRAVVDHFRSAGQADAEEVIIASCTVLASYIAGVPDPILRGRLLARARRSLDVLVAQIAFEDAARAREGAT